MQAIHEIEAIGRTLINPIRAFWGWAERPAIDKAVSEAMVRQLLETAGQARENKNRRARGPLPVLLAQVQEAVETAGIPELWTNDRERIRQFARDVLTVHKNHAGEETHACLNEASRYREGGYAHTRVTFLNGQQDRLLVQFAVATDSGKWSTGMSFCEGSAEENKALNDRYAQLPQITQVGVAWLFMEAARIVSAPIAGEAVT